PGPSCWLSTFSYASPSPIRTSARMRNVPGATSPGTVAGPTTQGTNARQGYWAGDVAGERGVLEGLFRRGGGHGQAGDPRSVARPDRADLSSRYRVGRRPAARRRTHLPWSRGGTRVVRALAGGLRAVRL